MSMDVRSGFVKGGNPDAVPSRGIIFVMGKESFSVLWSSSKKDFYKMCLTVGAD